MTPSPFDLMNWLKKKKEEEINLRALQKSGRSRMRVNIKRLEKKKGKVFRNWQKAIDREDEK